MSDNDAEVGSYALGLFSIMIVQQAFSYLLHKTHVYSFLYFVVCLSS